MGDPALQATNELRRRRPNYSAAGMDLADGLLSKISFRGGNPSRNMGFPAESRGIDSARTASLLQLLLSSLN